MKISHEWRFGDRALRTLRVQCADEEQFLRYSQWRRHVLLESLGNGGNDKGHSIIDAWNNDELSRAFHFDVELHPKIGD